MNGLTRTHAPTGSGWRSSNTRRIFRRGNWPNSSVAWSVARPTTQQSTSGSLLTRWFPGLGPMASTFDSTLPVKQVKSREPGEGDRRVPGVAGSRDPFF